MNLSASRLVTFHTCRLAYNLRYLLGVKQAPVRSSVLGTALHAALEQVYKIPYYEGKPDLNRLKRIWEQIIQKIDIGEQSDRGWTYLEKYYDTHIDPLEQWIAPVGVEQRMAFQMLLGGIRFDVSGRYDLLTYYKDGLHLIDFKLNPPKTYALDVDIQLGLYSILLQEIYGLSLLRVSHRFLSTDTYRTFEVNDYYRDQILERIKALAQALVNEEEFCASPGTHCSKCSVKKSCSVFTGKELPPNLQKSQRLQLALQLV